MNWLSDVRDYIGYLAGFLATLAFLPQVVKTIRERRTRDISLGMYVLLCTGVGLWFMYGLLINAWPLVLSNGVTLVLIGTILALKIKHG